MTKNERVRQVRKNLNLTQEDFGSKIGIRKAAVSSIERGASNLSEHTAVSICRAYHVNYDWLISGEGEMFAELPSSLLDKLCEEYNCTDADRKVVEEYLKLTPDERATIIKYMRSIVDSSN